jgi:transposase
MAHAQQIPVKESADEIKRLLSGAPTHLRPRLKLLQQLSRGVFSIDILAAKVGASRNSVAAWKRLYKNNGLEALVADQRGGDHRSSIDAAGKQKLDTLATCARSGTPRCSPTSSLRRMASTL